MITWSAHLSTLFASLPPLERPAAARAAGFTRAETWWPPAEDPGRWAGALREAGLRAAIVNADGGDLAAGERGYCNVPGREDEVLAAVGSALELVVACDGVGVNLLVGREAPDRPRAAQLAQAREVVAEGARLAAAAGRVVVVEHLNAADIPGSLLPTPADAARFVREVGQDGARLLYDAYHAGCAGLDPTADVGRHVELIAHVQYADAPGRGAPGTGRVDLWRFVDRLESLGYAGTVGLEYHPAAGDAIGPPRRERPAPRRGRP